MREWRMIPANEYCSSVRDGTHDTPRKTKFGHKLVTGKHVYDGEIHPGDAYFISDDDFEQINLRSKVEQWDVLMSMIGTVGSSAVVSTVPDFAIKNIALFKCGGSELKGKWLSYYLSSPQAADLIASRMKGSTQKFLSLGQLREIPVPVPPQNYMQRAVMILSAYDKLIENRRKQIALLEEAAQRLYKEWFVDLRFLGHETTPIIDGLPEGWRNGLLGDFISFVSGYAFKSTSFSQQGEYKVVTIKNVLDGKFDNSGMSSISDFPENMPGECMLHQGDILISLTGNVGRVCQVIGEKYVLNQRVAKIKTEAKAFTYCFLRLRTTKTLLENMSSGTAQKNLSPIKTLQMPIMIPDERLIQLFELRGQPLLAAIVNLESQIECTREARDRLLPKLMSGEIEVS